jgi:hypothetical protein
MSKESYIGGDNIVWVGGTTKEYIGKGIYSSQQKLLITTEGTKHFGDNPETYETEIGEYVIDGYWSRDIEGSEKINEARIGDKVYFHVQVQNIPIDFLPESIKNKITFGLFNYRKLEYPMSIKFFSYLKDIHLPNNESKEIEYITWDDINENKQLDEEEKGSIKPYNSVLVNQAKAVIPLTLSEGLNNYFVDKRDLQLYFKTTYYTDLNIQLPKIEDDFLKVKYVNGRIIFQKASDIHPFPMVFDTKTGDPYYIDAKKNIQKSGLYVNKIKGLLIPQQIDMFTKKSYEFAIRRLKAGELVFSDGTIGKTKRLYEYTVNNIDETFREKIVIGVNKGNFQSGVSSKSINQLEAFSSKGIAGGAKFIGKVMPLFSAVMDLSNMMIAVGNGEKPPIPFMPPFVTWEVERICKEIEEFEYELFFKGLNNVLFGKVDYYKKGIEAVEIFIEQWNFQNSHAKYKWKVVHLSQPTLEKLLTGEIKKIEHIEALTSMGNPSEINCGILVFTSYEEEGDINHYVYATFLPEILE